MNDMALATIRVAVLVERRPAKSQWVDFIWQPVGVLTGQPETPPWTVVREENGVTTFYAGFTDIALYRTETTNYRLNLLSGRPSLWVVLRPTDVDPPYQLVTVTADPAEGEAFTEAGNDVVEVVPMPPVVCEAVEAFIAEHHVDREFIKRKRDRLDPNLLGRRPEDSD
jgi:hypothetical protein